MSAAFDLEQLQSIQSMLTAGHRSVRLERHSLWLLGGVGGFIVAVTEYVITADRFPDIAQRALALLAWLVVWLGALCVVDHRLTRRARERRDETLPFAQAQLTRAWWMLLGMGTLGSIGMFFHGGGSMIYVLWIVLLGLGIYLFGLFSQPLIEWIGLATILIGVAALAAGLPYGTTHWLAASCFGIGMPLAGWVRQRVGESAPWSCRVLGLLAWIALVALPPVVLAQRLPQVATPTGPVVAATQVQTGAGEQVLRLPAGTPVALTLDLEGPVMSAPGPSRIALKLDRSMEVVLRDGEPDGRYRVGEGGRWHGIHDGVLALRIDRLMPAVVDGQPVVKVHAEFGRHFIPGEDR